MSRVRRSKKKCLKTKRELPHILNTVCKLSRLKHAFSPAICSWKSKKISQKKQANSTLAKQQKSRKILALRFRKKFQVFKFSHKLYQITQKDFKTLSSKSPTLNSTPHIWNPSIWLFLSWKTSLICQSRFKDAGFRLTLDLVSYPFFQVVFHIE